MTNNTEHIQRTYLQATEAGEALLETQCLFTGELFREFCLIAAVLDRIEIW